MRQPLVSVVIATHNRAGLLVRAVASILAQSCQDFEILVVDDSSSDGTAAVLPELRARDCRIRTFGTGTNLGPGGARNFGVQHARGEFIAIMDDDDVALPGRLEVQAQRLLENARVGLVFSSVAWVDRDLHVFGVFPGIVERGAFPAEPEEVFQLLYLENNKIPNTTITVKREVITRMGYPASPWIGEDWFWCMQLAASGVRMKAISEPLVHQTRDTAIPGLMAQRTAAMRAQRQILRMIREWLQTVGIRRFDRLHRAALANQMVREARCGSGLKGLLLCSMAAFLAPANPKPRDTMVWLAGKALRKCGIRAVHSTS